MAEGLTQAHRDQIVASFEDRPAFVVSLLDADGEPFATRGWGLRFDDTGATGRLLLAAEELRAAGLADRDLAGARIAVNHVDVGTLRSVQVKGGILGVEPPGDDDRATYAAYRQRFFAAVVEVDKLSWELLETMEPESIVACTFRVDVAFDQSPGPRAGRTYGEP